ncbi:MAG: sensor histidine kinase [Gallionella sp.]|nr:sensor histidine kinase [Gallionella sp.]
MASIDALKKNLTDALAEKVVNYGQILQLANEIGKLDKESVRFSVDASHVSRLGLELVSKQETAVAELIKNAYDADASTVNLIFRGSETRGGILEIVDNGQGMSREQLINGFMRISTQEKVHNPASVIYARQRAGRKGIGRFSTQRLGEKLCIETQLEGLAHSLRLEIDWNEFEGGKELHLISNQIVEAPQKERCGTTLKILMLRDAWTESQIQRTFRYVSELLQPFPLDENAGKGRQDDPGFKVTIFREKGDGLAVVASEDQLILSHAVAKITGQVDDIGTPFVSVDSSKYHFKLERRKLEFEPRLNPKTGLSIIDYPLLAGIRFSAHYFIADELPTGTRGFVRDLLTRHGGVRIYRNGFRVLPYGEAFDDWLGLQRSSALRALLPPHHNTNFLGFVEIVDVGGERFEETASREGLLENEAFLQLQDYVYRALMAGVIELARLRNKKIFASDDPVEPSSKTKPFENPRDTASYLAEQLRSMGSASTDGTNSSGDAHNANQHVPDAESLAKGIEEFGEQTQRLLEENGMLRVLASLGLTIGEFTHEVRHALAGLNATVDSLGSENDEADESSSLYDSLRSNIGLLQSYVRYFDSAVIQNAHRKLETHELRDLVGEFTAVIEPSLRRQNIEVATEFRGYDLFTKPMHKSEWASIFLNLFTNSLKAIHRAGSKGRINIVAGSVDDRLYLEFSDNGDGIPQENFSKIFDAFFTTSAPPGALSSDSDKLVGTGLGLKIVRDILDAANGEIELVVAPDNYKTCFRIEIPCATEEEIGNAKY